MKETILKFKDLSSYSDDWTIIKKFNFDIYKGEVFSLVGENGSGKTTFINSFAGLIEEIEGEIIFKGKKLSEELRNKHIGFLFENSSLIPNLSVAENLTLTSFPRRGFFPFINWSKANKAAKEILNKYNLKIDVNKQVANLPSEEKKIVEIIKILLKEPEVIVLHEPTNGLSIETISKLYSIINQYKQGGGTVIYVTKRWEEALKIADRISVVAEGKIAGTLLAENAKKNPRRLLNFYLGNCHEEIDDNNEDLVVFDAVFKAAELLTSEYELRDILLFFSEHATKVMNADDCIIDLIDEKTNALIDTVSYQSNDNFKVQLKKEAILKIIKNNNLYYVTERDKEFSSLFVDSNGVKTIMCAPVKIRSQVAGIIQIYYNNIYVYSEKEWRYLSTLARQAAIAIEDTRLMGRSALLQESHHRIKNNLQSIISLVSLQKDFLDENITYEAVDNILNDIISRIKSIAAVHDLLSKDEMGRSIINLKEIVNKVLQLAAYPAGDKDIKINLLLDDILIPYSKATTITLIINELVANCFEHAFPNTSKGTIDIVCQKFVGNIYLIVKDNGIGLPAGFDIRTVKSLGLTIVYSLIVNEYQGKIEVKSTAGTEIKIILPAKKCFLH